MLFAGFVDLTTVLRLRKIGFKEHRLRFGLLAPRRDAPEADRSLSSGLREEARETDDEMGCGPQKLRATKILGHVALLLLRPD